MSVIDRLRQTRNAEEIAQEIEPLAQAMAALSDDLKETLEDLKNSINVARCTLENSSGKLTTCTNAATTQAENIKNLFGNCLKEQKSALQWFDLKMTGLLLLTSLVSGAGAGIGLWIWQEPSKEIEKNAQNWIAVATTYNELSPAKKHQFRQLMNWREPEPEPKTEPPKP
jgi:hypothetical protein